MIDIARFASRIQRSEKVALATPGLRELDVVSASLDQTFPKRVDEGLRPRGMGYCCVPCMGLCFLK